MFRIRLFGGHELTEPDSGSVLSVLSQPKRMGLLVYLLIAQPRGFHRRDKILALFWPHADEEHARNSLRQSLHFLRRSLGEDAIVSRGEDIAADASRFSCDVLAFDEAVNAKKWGPALELYRGPLLAGFHISGVQEFDRWLENERERLRVAAAEAGAELVRLEERRGDLVGAVEAARRWAGVSPASGPANRKLVQLLAQRGDRAGALKAFERFKKRIWEDFGLEPTDEMKQMVEAIRGGVGREPAQGRGHREGLLNVPGASEEPDPTSRASPIPPPAGIGPDQTLLEASSRATGPPAPLRSPDRRVTGPKATWTIVVFMGMIALGYVVFFVGRGDGRTPVRLNGFSDRRPTTEGDPLSHRLWQEVVQAMDDSSSVVRPVTDDSDFRFLLTGTILSDEVQLSLWDIDPEVSAVEWSHPHVGLDLHALAIQIVRDIETAMGGRDDLTLPMTMAGTYDTVAAQAYLQGRALWLLRDPGSFEEAIGYFEKALEADPSYALAFAALADVFNLLGAYDYGLRDPSAARDSAKMNADQALSLESDLPQAWTALATTAFFYEWDSARAGELYRSALELDPAYVHGHQWLSLLLAVQERFVEARFQIDEAMGLDSSEAVLAGRARIDYFARDFGLALSWYEKALEAGNDFVPAHLGRGLAALMAGEYEIAAAAYDDAERYLGGPAPVILAVKGHLQGRVGNADSARAFLAGLERAKMELDFVPPEYFAMIHLGLGEYERALDYLEDAYDNGSNVMTILEVEPLLDPLRTNERFRSLQDRVWEGRIR